MSKEVKNLVVTSTENEIDWNDVEYKVRLISHRFSTTIDWRYREDLEQELRIFAWTKSTNYWDMYRRAVDFYRHLNRKYYGETCVDDFTFVDDKESKFDNYEEKEEAEEYEKLFSLIRESVEGFSDYKKNYDKYSADALAVLAEIDRFLKGKVEYSTSYKRGRIQFNQLSDNLGISYKDVQNAIWLIKKVISALVAMKKISEDDVKGLSDFKEFKSF